MSYILEINDKKLAFTGDLIHNGGKIITYYDLQYFYDDNGDGSIKRSLDSFEKLMKFKPDLLLPFHGNIIDEPLENI